MMHLHSEVTLLRGVVSAYDKKLGNANIYVTPRVGSGKIGCPLFKSKKSIVIRRTGIY